MRRKVINPQILIELICYFLFSILMLYLVISNRYLSYVTPRMKPYIIFSAVVMALWACMGLRRLFKPQYKIRVAHCFVLVLPILMILMPHNSISATDLASGYVNLSEGIKSKDNQSSADIQNGAGELKLVDPIINDKPASENTYSNQENVLQDNELALTLSGYDEINKTITVSDAEFYPWLNEIFSDMNQFDGYKILIKGFVFTDDDQLQENEFVASRLLMSCCAADLIPCGIVCQYDLLSELEEEEWITVEGTIHIGKYMGNDEPQIMVEKIERADKPEDEYIYPY